MVGRVTLFCPAWWGRSPERLQVRSASQGSDGHVSGDNQDNSERFITKIGTMLQSSLNELDAVLMVARRGKF